LEEAGKGKWIEHKDVDSGAWYYFNPVTKVSSWERPSDFVEPCLVTEASIVGPKWTVSKDPTSRRFYYYNKESGQSTWERPSNSGESAAVASAATTTAASRTGHAPVDFSDVDEVIDLVASTAPSEFRASDAVYARIFADSEEGSSVVGIKLRMNTQWAKMMEAWADYQELPVASVFFKLGDRILVPMESPGDCGLTPERGVFTIHAHPCEEVTDEEAEEEERNTRAEVARWKNSQKKKRKKDRQEQIEFISEF